jgi:predicted DNA-binding protein (UPF0251 family)
LKKSAVERLKEALANDIRGMMMSEAADYLNISRSVLQSYLNEQLIPFEKRE